MVGRIELSWSAKQYVAFEDERTRPVRDLIAALPPIDARSVIDLGCGPGNSTEVLAARYPEARVAGIDTSQARQLDSGRTDRRRGLFGSDRVGIGSGLDREKIRVVRGLPLSGGRLRLDPDFCPDILDPQRATSPDASSRRRLCDRE